jgi:hypothetical protein
MGGIETLFMALLALSAFFWTLLALLWRINQD